MISLAARSPEATALGRSGHGRPRRNPARVVCRARIGPPAAAATAACGSRTSEAEANLGEVPEARRRPERRERGEYGPANERQRPARVIAVVHEEQLHRDHAVDE